MPTTVHYLHVLIVNEPTPVTGTDVAWTFRGRSRSVAWWCPAVLWPTSLHSASQGGTFVATPMVALAAGDNPWLWGSHGGNRRPRVDLGLSPCGKRQSIG